VTAKPNLSTSLQRLLKRSQEEADPSATNWVSWFSEPRVKKGFLGLQRGGRESFVSSILAAQLEGESPVLLVDTLLPTPEPDFYHEPVTLFCEARVFDSGIEEITTFTASVGETVDLDGKPALKLGDLLDLKKTAQEYIAAPGDAFQVELGMIWFGEWKEIAPRQLTVSRLFFELELEGEIGPDGYAVPRASLRLGSDSPEIPIQLTIKRLRGGGFEAIIEKMDSLARQKLTALVEEIWRIDCGLSQRRVRGGRSEVGYRTNQHDPLASVFEPHILFLTEDERWSTLLAAKGEIRSVAEDSLEAVSEAVAEGRCDLLVGDKERWGDRAIRVERLLRSVSKFRDIPRIWITSTPPKHDLFSVDGETESDETSSGEAAAADLDLVDYGAFDLIPRSMKDSEIDRHVSWALGGTELGQGQTLCLISQDNRLKYRLGLALASQSVRFFWFSRLEGLVPMLDKQHPRWVLLDSVTFEVEMDALLARATAWTASNGGDVFVLSRGASEGKIRTWLKHGADDIVLLDPSLRQTARRLHNRLSGEQ